jgi:hypothetical protein
LEEVPGDKYPDLNTVQQLAKRNLAVSLAATITCLMEQGILIVKDGKIVPNTEN